MTQLPAVFANVITLIDEYITKKIDDALASKMLQPELKPADMKSALIELIGNDQEVSDEFTEKANSVLAYVVEEYDFDSKIKEACDNYDWDDAVRDGIANVDIGNMVQAAADNLEISVRVR